MLRALRETAITGVATTLPAHLVILEHPDFIAVRQSANWVDTELDLSAVVSPAAADGAATAPASLAAKAAAWRTRRGVPSVSTWSPNGASQNGAPQAAATGDRTAKPGQILASMPGTIVRMLVAVGDQVQENDGICVIEAMKMENVVRAGRAGSVAEIHVSPGDPVDSGAPIAVIASGGPAGLPETNAQTTGAQA
jgi:acetyl-CoA/propionyl-CoA carboxylase biotin carboxyl carrier protein